MIAAEKNEVKAVGILLDHRFNEEMETPRIENNMQKPQKSFNQLTNEVGDRSSVDSKQKVWQGSSTTKTMFAYIRTAWMHLC